MLDYIIVGSGLAGIAFSEFALQNNKNIVVINDQSQNASKIAAGLYNPVILKRFSEVWQANEQLKLLSSFYASLEAKLEVKLDYKLPLLRNFYSIEEQNNWFIASDKPNLSKFLSTNLITKKWEAIPSPFNFGEVLHSGFVDTGLLLNCYQKYLMNEKLFYDKTFNYALLKIENDFVHLY